jgi:hypothetical protein
MINNLKKCQNCQGCQNCFACPYAPILILILVIVIGVYFYRFNKEKISLSSNLSEKTENLEILGNTQDLVSLSIKPGDQISGLLNLTGSVKNAYFFEANILINLLDDRENILKESYGTATSDWMTIEPVSFEASIDARGLSGQGYLEIKQDDPSDGEGGPVKRILIPVFFE